MPKIKLPKPLFKENELIIMIPTGEVCRIAEVKWTWFEARHEYKIWGKSSYYKEHDIRKLTYKELFNEMERRKNE